VLFFSFGVFPTRVSARSAGIFHFWAPCLKEIWRVDKCDALYPSQVPSLSMVLLWVASSAVTCVLFVCRSMPSALPSHFHTPSTCHVPSRFKRAPLSAIIRPLSRVIASINLIHRSENYSTCVSTECNFFIIF